MRAYTSLKTLKQAGAKVLNPAAYEIPPQTKGVMADFSEGQTRPKAALSALKPLIPYGLAYKGRIAAALVALAMASAATLVVPVAVRRVIDFGFSEQGRAYINAYFVLLIIVVGVLALASALRYYLVITLGERVVADLRSAVFRHLTSLDPAFFDQTRSGEIVSRLTADTTQVKAAFGVSISIALRNLFLFLGATVLMIITSPKLSALVLLAIPVIVLPLVFSGRAVRRRSRAAQDRLADASAYAAEAIGAVRTMQAFGMERLTASRFAAAAEEAFDAARLSTTMRAFLTGAGIFLVSASVVGVLWYGAQDVLAGDDDRRAPVAIRPLRRLCRKLPRPALRGLWRARPGGRRGGAPRRDPRRQARGRGAAATPSRCPTRPSAPSPSRMCISPIRPAPSSAPCTA